MIITSKHNPLIKSVISLSEKKFRLESGLYVVEGVKSVSECISAGMETDKIFCTEKYSSAFPDPVIVSPQVFGAMSSEVTPQGVLATVKIPSNPIVPPQNSCLFLDGIRDPGNLGTIIRTANAAGYAEIYLADCADPYSPKAVRASMSGIFFVKLITCGREEAAAALSSVPLIVADMRGENIFSFRPPEKFCLCIGNEANGVSEFMLSRAAYKVSIPMRASCESLNAGVSAGIAMYALKNNLKEV